ncbi:GNAT family N-acetyltransferase [Phycisphaeraceae bacterium D3-23]
MPSCYDIRIDDLTGPGVVGLLRGHLAFVAQHSPAGSIHALDPAALQDDPSLTFWGVWDQAALVGCGAMKELGPCHGEIKSMITSPDHRRRGVASAMLGAPSRDSAGQGV